MNWDDLEESQFYETIFMCECGRVWTGYSQTQRNETNCNSCGKRHKADYYTIFDCKKDTATKMRFWQGSLTWILDTDKRKGEMRKALSEEFKLLNDIWENPTKYYPEVSGLGGMTGGHFVDKIKELGWPDWESLDIHSFWHNCGNEERVYNA